MRYYFVITNNELKIYDELTISDNDLSFLKYFGNSEDFIKSVVNNYQKLLNEPWLYSDEEKLKVLDQFISVKQLGEFLKTVDQVITDNIKTYRDFLHYLISVIKKYQITTIDNKTIHNLFVDNKNIFLSINDLLAWINKEYRLKTVKLLDNCILVDSRVKIYISQLNNYPILDLENLKVQYINGYRIDKIKGK